MDESSTLYTSYAQNFEDAILRAYFHDIKKGFYVDVGANHPVVDSVTNLFYEDGWRGINIEPLPEMFLELKRLRKDDINIQAAVSQKKSSIILHVYHTAGGFNGLSTASHEQEIDIDKKKRTDVTSKEDITVPSIPLKEILHNELPPNKHIHFMKVDVEGLEDDVLRSNDWEKFSPEVICIEADHVFVNWKDFLKSKGYRLDYFDGVNEYYVHKKSSRSLPELYVEHILMKNYIKLGSRMLMQHEQDETNANYLGEIGSLSSRIGILENKAASLNNSLTNANLELQKRDSLKFLIRHVPIKIGERIEKSIDKLKTPSWEYPDISSPDSSDLNELMELAGRGDKVFSEKPVIPLFKRVMYVVLNFIFKVTRKISIYIYSAAKAIYIKARR